jgi:hypothetical protein
MKTITIRPFDAIFTTFWNLSPEKTSTCLFIGKRNRNNFRYSALAENEEDFAQNLVEKQLFSS